MLRSRLSRLLALGAFVVAGLAGPIWELGHAWRHLHEHERVAPEAHRSATATGLPGMQAEELHGHDHPSFQVAARPFREAAPAAAALLVRGPAAPAPRPVFVSLNTAPVLARAGPAAHLLAQPRAPPLR